MIIYLIILFIYFYGLMAYMAIKLYRYIILKSEVIRVYEGMFIVSGIKI